MRRQCEWTWTVPEEFPTDDGTLSRAPRSRYPLFSRQRGVDGQNGFQSAISIGDGEPELEKRESPKGHSVL